VCLSVDDGWKANLPNIIPVVSAFSIPICFFISTEPVENGVFWWSYVSKFVETDFNSTMSVNDFKTIPEGERRKKIGELKASFLLEREAMTKEELFEISKKPFITIGSHTVNHACLNRCNEAELLFEIKESKHLLEGWTNKGVKYFSYPNGDFTGVEHNTLVQNGYLMAFTTKQGFIDVNNHDLFYLPRFSVNDKGTFTENICKMTGTWQKMVGRILNRRTGGFI